MHQWDEIGRKNGRKEKMPKGSELSAHFLNCEKNRLEWQNETKVHSSFLQVRIPTGELSNLKIIKWTPILVD